MPKSDLFNIKTGKNTYEYTLLPLVLGKSDMELFLLKLDKKTVDIVFTDL